MTGTGGRYDAVVIGGRPQRPHRRLLPGGRRPVGRRSRAGERRRGRRRHRGAHSRASGSRPAPTCCRSCPGGSWTSSTSGRPVSSTSPATRGSSCHFPTAPRSRGGAIRSGCHAELAKISKRDADRFADYEAFIERAASVMDRFILRNPPSWAEVAAEFRSPADLAVFQKCFLGSAADIAEHFFESEKLQAVVAATGIIGTFRGPRDPGTGYVKLYHSMGMATGNRGAWTYVRGAMGAVTQALGAGGDSRGAVIRTDAEVREVLIRDGRATGVVLADGEEIGGRVVLSNADPVRTYLGLVPRRELPDDYRRAVEAIKIESPVMKINLAITEPPRFTMLPAGADPRRLLGRPLHRAHDRLHAARVRRGSGRPAGRPPVPQRPPPVGRGRLGRAARPPHPLDLHPVLPVPARGGDVGRAARRHRRPGAGGARALRAERARLRARPAGAGPARTSRPASA